MSTPRISISRTTNADGTISTHFIPAPACWPPLRGNPPDALLADCPNAARTGSLRPRPSPPSAAQPAQPKNVIHMAPAAHRAEPLEQDTVIGEFDGIPIHAFPTLRGLKDGDIITMPRGETLTVRAPISTAPRVGRLHMALQLAGGLVGLARNARALYRHHRRMGRRVPTAARMAVGVIYHDIVDPLVVVRL